MTSTSLGPLLVAAGWIALLLPAVIAVILLLIRHP
jgi:hypothetical protein